MLNFFITAPSRRPRWVLACAVSIALLSGLIALWAYPQLSSRPSDFEDPASEVVRAQHAFFTSTGAKPDEGIVAIVHLARPLAANEPAPASVAKTASLLRASAGVRAVADYVSTGDRSMISRDGTETFVMASYGDIDQKKLVTHLRAAVEDDASLRGRVTLGGPTMFTVESVEVSTQDLGTAESVALPLMVAGLLWVLRGVVAAVIPLLGAAFSILCAFIGIGVATLAGSVSVFAMNLVTALGLGLSVDFSLLIIIRFREELADGADTAAALSRTLGTAGRTVAFSASIVAACMFSLLLFPQKFLASMGAAGGSVTVGAAVFALVVLPALLRLLGPRINALMLPWRRRTVAVQRNRWFRLARQVHRRPVLYAGAAAVSLIAVALPFARASFSGYDASILPLSTGTGSAYHALTTDFTSTDASSVTVLVSSDAGASGIARYAVELGRVNGVRAVAPARPVGPGRWQVDVSLVDPPLSVSARTTLKNLERAPAPGSTSVIGETASFDALLDSLGQRLPLVAGLMGLLSLCLVAALLRSAVLPLQNIVMNLLTLSATFGALVVVFQWGWLHVGHAGSLEATSLIIVGVLTFGLSTDYGVFLLSRIREERSWGAADDEAVALGLGRTGPVVSAAAALLFIPLFALTFSQLPPLRELGFGAALAVVIDATVVRGVLVPALMALLGHWNWWFPVRARTRGAHAMR